MPDTQMTTYRTQYTNIEVAHTMDKMEQATLGVDRDLMIVSCLVMALCLSDPDIQSNQQRFRNALDSISTHICWVLGLEDKPIADKDMN